MNDKSDLRRQMRACRASLAPPGAAVQAQAVTRQVLKWNAYQRARAVMLYAPLPEELDTTALLDHVLADCKQLILPRCSPSGTLDAVAVKDWRALTPGAFHVMEPTPDAPAINPARIDLVLVPGLAFDRRGFRLGWGKGYYDRFLRGIAAVTAGLAYEEQILSTIPTEPHDISLHYLISAQGVKAMPKIEKGCQAKRDTP